MGKTLDIAIGKKLPLDILMQPVALLAQRGWGKTVTAKGCYEAAHDAGAQCITIFPTGKWWSLRLAADGKGPGLTDVFIIGGPHGDVPLTPSSGKVIAKLLVEKRIHAVLDVSLLRKSERHRFLADLFEEFWLLKKLENENYPVVLFIEEAHAIAPQMLRQGQIDEARMLGAVEDLAAEGRNHGIGIVLLDQRSARGEVKLGKGELAVLTAIAQHADEGVTREQLSVLTGYKRSSRDTYLQKLAAAHLFSQRGERLYVTSHGVAALPDDFEPLPTGDELRRHWLARLPEGERRILEVLITAFPRPMQREELAEVTEYKRSSRDTYLQKLGARRLVEMPSRGEVVASATLFA